MELNTLVLISLLLFSTISHAQSDWTCSGQVVEQATQEPLIGANIYTSDFKHGTTTDEYGRYSIRLSNDYDELICSYIGYEIDTCSIAENCYFELQLQKLKEVVVKGSKQNQQNELGIFSPSMEQIKALPPLLGDVDILKSMTLLPGISGGVEGSSGMLVRGGNLSHNLILLDGTPVYNSNHLYGFVSSFNPNAIKHVELYKGGFPAQYGGRLASVLNLTMKDGNMRKYAADLSIGLVNSSLLFEGPIKKDRASFMFAARMLNLSPILGIVNRVFDLKSSYWMHDMNAKVKVKLNKKQSLYLGYFQGQDVAKTTLNSVNLGIKWGNRVVSVRYNNQVSTSLFVDAGLYFNQFKINNATDVLNNGGTSTTLSTSAIRDYSAKLKASWVISTKYRLNFGTEISRKEFIPVDYLSETRKNSGELTNKIVEITNISTKDAVLYMDNKFIFSNGFKFNVGARGLVYENDSFNYIGLDLRASVSYSFGRSIFKLNYDEMIQPFHLLTSTGDNSPNEIWIPSLNGTPPSSSKQLSLGYSVKVPSIKSFVSIEAYYKQMNNLVRYKPGSRFEFIQRNDWRNNVLGEGTGTAKGLEIFLNRQAGRLTGWIGYTLSWSDRKYSQANRGEWFPANFSRRHDLELITNFSISKKWTVNSTFVVQSGRPLTLPTNFYLDSKENGGVLKRYVLVYGQINGNKTNPYHRLDISFSKKYQTKRNRTAGWTFGAYNVYGQDNTFSTTLRIEDTDESAKITASQNSFLKFIPFFSYNIKY